MNTVDQRIFGAQQSRLDGFGTSFTPALHLIYTWQSRLDGFGGVAGGGGGRHRTWALCGAGLWRGLWTREGGGEGWGSGEGDAGDDDDELDQEEPVNQV